LRCWRRCRGSARRPELLPPFSTAAQTAFALLARPGFRADLWVTTLELLEAIAIALPAGTLLGLLLAKNEKFARIVDPRSFFLFSIPKSIFLPLFILSMGIGFWQKVAFGVFSTIVIARMSTTAAVRLVRPDHVFVARSFGASRVQIAWRVYLPSMLPILLEGLRLTVIFGFTAVLLAEMYASRTGVGHQIARWGESFMMDRLFAGVLLLAVLAIGFDIAMGRGQSGRRRITRHHLTHERRPARMSRPLPILPTTVVGSYPQPEWLVDHGKLKARGVPRIRAPEIWRVAEPFLEEAQDDATRVAIRDMERAGIDIITGGEIRRASYSSCFALSLEGVDRDTPGEMIGRTGLPTLVPRVTGRGSRGRPVEVRDVAFARANTDRAVKITLPGPFTMTRQAKNEFYADDAERAMDFTAALNAESRTLKAARADVIQLDEPWMQAFPDKAPLRRARDQPRTRGHRGNDGGASLLRLCRDRDGQAGRLFLPAGAHRLGGTADLDRGRAAEARPRDPQGPAGQDGDARRARPRLARDRDAGDRGRADPRGPRRPAHRADRSGTGLRREVPAARARLRQAPGAGQGCRNRPQRACQLTQGVA
jgi:ABC-type nitrate/sulfonate/bicarbonate transport system permease component